MNRWLALVSCLFLCSFTPIRAQVSPKRDSAISGMVVKEPGSLPLRKVLLELIAENQKTGSNYSATSDPDGRFSIESVKPGRYRVFLEKSGYVQVNSRGRKTVSDVLSIVRGQLVNDLLFHMLPNAVITGRVTDEDGEPMSRVSIYVKKKMPGRSRPSEDSGIERTDDRGEYRFYGLFPGQYFVIAVPPPDARDYIHPPTTKPDLDSNAETRYLPTFYPGTRDGTQASPIVLRPGDETPINFLLTPTRTYRVRGMVTGFLGRQGLTVQLLQKGVNAGLAPAGAEVSRDGRFEIRGVAPGSYIARVITEADSADTPVFTANEEVRVLAGDIDGLKLALSPAFSLTGHVRLDGAAAVGLSQYAVILHPDRASDDGVPSISHAVSSPIDRVGNFQWTNVFPGDYIVSVPGIEESGAYLKSVTLGDRNGDLGFSVSGPASLELVINPNGGTIEGAVLEPGADQDQPVANATVVAVPEMPYRKIPTRFTVGLTDQNGRFTLRGLPPGSYTLFAWQDIENDLYRDAEFLKSQQSNGTKVKVEEGSQQAIALRPSPIPEDWQ